MTRIRTQLATVVVALLLVVSAVPLSDDTATAAQHSFVVEQGDRCFAVNPLQGEQDVESFYDYRTPENSDYYTYSTHMPDHLPREDVSRLFLYEGPDGVSLVMVHNERDGTGGGHAVSFDFQGLPGEGGWAVMDDDYGGQDDRFSRDSIDWTLRSDRTDGGAFRGLDQSGTAITVTPRFNEDAELYDDFNRSDRIESWQFLSGNLDSPDATGMQMGQAITIRTGSCTDETPPNAALEVATDDPTEGHRTVFDASNASDDETGIAEYRWDFDGNGEVDRTTDGPQTGYVYNETGSFDAAVTVVDGGDNEDTAVATVSVDADDPPTPALEVSTTEPAEGAQVGFDASNSTDDTGIAEYRWSFGDGTNATGETVTHSYDGNETYTVTLEIVDEGGNEATEQVDLDVQPSDDAPPEVAANATPAEVEAGANVTFDAGDSTDNRDIASYAWEFGDGVTATGESVTHVYDAAGTYDATVTVTDESGNANSTDVRVEVLEAGNPTARLSVSDNETKVGEEVTFDASNSSDEGTGIAEYRWDFDGNGTVDETSDAATMPHEYDAVGNVTPTVTVVDRAGNADSATVAMVVEQNEKAIDDGSDSGGSGGGSAGSGGGSSGGGGAASTAPPSIVTSVEQLGPNAAAVDVQNGRTGETIWGELPESEAAGETGVRFTQIGVNLASDDAHFVIETDRAAESADEGPADEVPADVTLGSLAVETKYLDGGTVENATYEVTVERTRLDEAGLAPDDLAVYQRTDGEWTQVDATVEERDGRILLRAHADALADFAVGADRSLTVSDAALADEEVAASDPVEVTATVRNEGTDRAEFDVDLVADGDVVATKTVEIAGGETAEVAFERRLDPGAHELSVEGQSIGSVTVADPVADIAVADVSLNASTIAPGERVEITATVENAGAKAGEHEVALTLFGEQLENRTVEVAAGETEEVTFVRQISAEGTYTAEVGDRAAEITVGDSQADDESAVPSAPVPGFGVGTAVVALLAAALLARIRRSGGS